MNRQLLFYKKIIPTQFGDEPFTFAVVCILIAFENTISLSVDSLILSARTLIVVACPMRKQNNEEIHLLPMCCFCVVTSSRCHTWNTINRKCVYYERDNV